MVVRELTGGIYFGKPRGFSTNENGEEIGFNTEVYGTHEIDRIARVAFETARKRRGKLCSVDKANVLEASMLWRKRVTLLASEYPDVELSHMYVDNAACAKPKAGLFDTIVTNNIFGDILSDEASMITGSIGMLPSASLGESGPGLFEPIHGSAPDIAGLDKANPLATVLSAAMLLRYGLGEEKAAQRIEAAVLDTLDRGFRTLRGTGSMLTFHTPKRTFEKVVDHEDSDESQVEESKHVFVSLLIIFLLLWMLLLLMGTIFPFFFWDVYDRAAIECAAIPTTLEATTKDLIAAALRQYKKEA
ncbi:hypothetical protein ACS0TY_021753 [Phlomoides rotata]